jgi:hypothetical protein
MTATDWLAALTWVIAPVALALLILLLIFAASRRRTNGHSRLVTDGPVTNDRRARP